MPTIDVSVKPTGVAVNGNEVECDLKGAEVTDDAIFLPQSGDYDINFKLDAAGAASWDTNDPFCAKNGKCPPPKAAAHGQVTLKSVSAKTLTVTAKAPGQRNVVHYRLNFADGTTCDPIIIRD